MLFPNSSKATAKTRLLFEIRRFRARAIIDLQVDTGKAHSRMPQLPLPQLLQVAVPTWKFSLPTSGQGGLAERLRKPHGPVPVRAWNRKKSDRQPF